MELDDYLLLYLGQEELSLLKVDLGMVPVDIIPAADNLWLSGVEKLTAALLQVHPEVEYFPLHVCCFERHWFTFSFASRYRDSRRKVFFLYLRYGSCGLLFLFRYHYRFGFNLSSL